MVNTGRPSRGCFMCRARRIKCDEGKPSCIRCQKSKRICPGYRDLFELVLRDETRTTKRKTPGHSRTRSLDSFMSEDHCDPYGNCGRSFSDSHALVYTAAPPPSMPESNWMKYDQSTWTDNSLRPPNHGNDNFQEERSGSRMASNGWFRDEPALVQQLLATPMDQQAVCFFVANYVLAPVSNSLTGRGHLDFLLPMLKTQPANSPLVMTFTSVGLATMAVQPNSKALMPMASSSYIKALKQINFALKDPNLALSDETLATIMLLVFFEQMTSTNKELSGWTSHTHGAVAIIKARGKKGFRSKIGRDLFIAVRQLMTIHYMAKTLPIDPGIDWWANGVENCREEDIMQSYVHFNLLVAELRHLNEKTTCLVPQTPANIEAVLALLRRAQDLEKDYREWYTTLPALWKANAIAWVDWSDLSLPTGGDLGKSVVHPGRVDVYKELGVAFSHNIIRSSQILIWTVILRCTAWLSPDSDYRITQEHKKAMVICTALIEDIVASVPYFFGWKADTDTATVTRSNNSISADVKGVCGLFLMWPLFVAVSSDFCSDSQRTFLRGRLKFIAENMGIRQAMIVLNVAIRHPSLYIMHERMKLKMSTVKIPSRTFSNASQSSTSSTLHA